MNLSWLRGALPPVQKLWDRFRYVLLVLAAGVLLLLLPLDGGGEGREAPAQEALQEAFSLEEFEEKLSDTLSQIQGAGEVRAVLSLKGGSRQVLAQDTQRGADGDASAATVTLSQGGGSQTVVPLQTLAPQFQGALVVCPGGNDPEVRLRITRAVSALTGLGSDRISVCPCQLFSGRNEDHEDKGQRTFPALEAQRGGGRHRPVRMCGGIPELEL